MDPIALKKALRLDLSFLKKAAYSKSQKPYDEAFEKKEKARKAREA